MKLMIDGIVYNVATWKVQLRHPKLIATAIVLASVLLLGIATGHADPSQWPSWSTGGGGRAPMFT